MYLHNMNIVCIENNSSMGVRDLDCMGGETVAETWQQCIRCASSGSIIVCMLASSLGGHIASW